MKISSLSPSTIHEKIKRTHQQPAQPIALLQKMSFLDQREEQFPFGKKLSNLKWLENKYIRKIQF